MPSAAEIGNAAATIAVVVAAAFRQQHAARHRHRDNRNEFKQLHRDIDSLRKRIDRWSGLP